MIIVETAVVSKSKGLAGFAPPGIPPCVDLYSFDILSAFVVSNCTANISLYRTSLREMGEAVIAETVRVPGVSRVIVGVGAKGMSRG